MFTTNGRRSFLLAVYLVALTSSVAPRPVYARTSNAAQSSERSRTTSKTQTGQSRPPGSPSGSQRAAPEGPGASAAPRSADTWIDWLRAHGFAITALVLLAWIIRGLVRELRPFGLHPEDPRCIRAGFGRYSIHSASGVALAANESHTEATHFSDIGGSLTSHSYSRVHHSFRVAGEGRPQDFRLTGWNISVVDGDRISVAWWIERGSQTGPVFLFVNHATGHVTLDNSLVWSVVRPRSLTVPCWVAFGAFVITHGGPISWAAAPWRCLSAIALFPFLFGSITSMVHQRRARSLERALTKRLVPELQLEAKAREPLSSAS